MSASRLAGGDTVESVFAGLEQHVRTTLSEPHKRGVDVWTTFARSLPPKRPRRRAVELLRRAFEAGIAFVLLTALSWLLLIVALAIWCDDRSSALFGHERVTRGGKIFTCWKFRTMRVGTQDELYNDPHLLASYVAANFKIHSSHDRRITRIGRFLRSSYLDELPQLWNVLRGDMSLVGPRPVVEQELVWYGPLAAELLVVRPGLTGAWQLTDGLGYPHRAWLELAYVRSRSFVLDAHIVFLTILTLVTAKSHPVAKLSQPLLPASEPLAPADVVVASEA
jgi:lipopolysaccharide/colanic/teichoic acid biosynthesis glycosyltransferase